MNLLPQMDFFKYKFVFWWRLEWIKNVNGSGSIQLDTVKVYTFNLTCSNSSTSTNASLSVAVEDTQTEDLDVHIIEDGVVAEIWGGNDYLSFFDELNGYGDCTDEVSGTETCQSVDWEVVSDSGRGDVLSNYSMGRTCWSCGWSFTWSEFKRLF